MPLLTPHLSTDDSGALVVGHGTRDDLGRSEFATLVSKLSALRPDWRIEACFLELAEPSVAAGLAALVQRGVRRVLVQPLLLFAAGHAKTDIPRALVLAEKGLPRLTIEWARPLGCHEQLLRLSAARFDEALVGQPEVGLDETALVLVGRGSHDPEATAEMHRFAQLRHERTPVAALQVCFAAMARPTLAEVLPTMERLHCRRIVVQPHLLFAGDLLSGIQRAVALEADRDRQHEWLMAGHLGPDDRLAVAIAENLEKLAALNQNSAEANNV